MIIGKICITKNSINLSTHMKCITYDLSCIGNPLIELNSHHIASLAFYTSCFPLEYYTYIYICAKYFLKIS